MSDRGSVALFVLCMLVLAGCSTVLSCDDGREVLWFSSLAEHMVNNGIKDFEEGNFSEAMPLFQSVADNKDAADKFKVASYKYLAFIHCISGRESLCRESFMKALEINPNFSLTLAEAGHPVWGPVFHNLKNKPAK